MICNDMRFIQRTVHFKPEVESVFTSAFLLLTSGSDCSLCPHQKEVVLQKMVPRLCGWKTYSRSSCLYPVVSQYSQLFLLNLASTCTIVETSKTSLDELYIPFPRELILSFLNSIHCTTHLSEKGFYGSISAADIFINTEVPELRCAQKEGKAIYATVSPKG